MDAELQRSAVAAQQQTIDRHAYRVNWQQDDRGWDCPGPAPEPRSKQSV